MLITLTAPKGDKMKGNFKITLLAFLALTFIFAANVKSDEIVPESGQEAHEVVTGDTLWDLSGEFYKNPFFWPILWSRNPDIKNPHLIYPEENINLLPGEQKKRVIEKIVIKEVIKEVPVIIIEEPEEVVIAVPEPEPVKPPPPPREPTIADLLDKNALATVGYFTLSSPEEAGLIQGGLENRHLLEKGSTVYIDKGTEHGISKGDAYTVISFVEGPTSEEVPKNGYVIKILGELVVDKVISEDQSLAKITEDYAEIGIGDILVPVFKIDGTTKISKDAPEVEDMKVVAAKESAPIIGDSGIVYLNKGAASGLKAGHKFSVYRGEYYGKHAKVKDAKQRFPEEKVGEAIVIYTTDETATAVISTATREVMITDRVRKDN
ncbi:LysM peptidoglycan-binding domain-containing protein [Thermodesulfobacteriota bacterium]